MGEVLFDPSSERAGLDERLPHPILLCGIATSRWILWKVELTPISLELTPISLWKVALTPISLRVLSYCVG